MTRGRRTLAAIAGLGAASVAYAVLVERSWFALRHATVPVLPPGSRPLRILHLSDLHLVPGQDRKAAFVRRCRDVAADLVVCTGDNLGREDAVDAAVALLADVAHGRPAVAVLGSNDYYGPTPKNPLNYLFAKGRRRHGRRLATGTLVEALRRAGWLVLENERACVTTASGEVDVAALGDPHIRRDRPDRVDWDPPATPVVLRLGLVHAPYRRALEQFAAAGYALVLSGHTHGGQLRVPGIGALVTNSDLRREHARGLSRHGRLWLHVSAGLGTSIYAPARFACRPEASVLDLVAAPPGGG